MLLSSPGHFLSLPIAPEFTFLLPPEWHLAGPLPPSSEASLARNGDSGPVPVAWQPPPSPILSSQETSHSALMQIPTACLCYWLTPSPTWEEAGIATSHAFFLSILYLVFPCLADAGTSYLKTKLLPTPDSRGTWSPYQVGDGPQTGDPADSQAGPLPAESRGSAVR